MLFYQVQVVLLYVYTYISNNYQGGDATDMFEAIGHSSEAYSMLQSYKIGQLATQEKSSNITSTEKKSSVCVVS